jgi:hypothetical protein
LILLMDSNNPKAGTPLAIRIASENLQMFYPLSQGLIMKFVTSSILLAALAASSIAHAAGETAQVQVSGAVAVNCTLAVTPTAKASSLSILAGESAAVVGTVTENCNSGTGYTVTLTSANAGSLLSTAAGAVPTTYQATYDDGAGAIASQIVATRNNAQFGRQGDLKVSFAGNSQAVAGQYNDTLNLIIAAK